MIVSLRTRLLSGIIITTALLLAVFSMVVYAVTRQSMVQHFDKSLLATAQMLSAVIEEEGIEHKSEGEHESEDEHQDETPLNPEDLKREIDFEFDVRMTPEFNNINGGAYYQIWTDDDTTLACSPSLGEQNLERFKLASDSVEYRTVLLPDKTPGRAISYPFLPRQENSSEEPRLENQKLTLVLAQSTAEIIAHLNFLTWLLLISSIGVVFLSTGIAFLVTRTSLHPIHSLAGKITAVGEDNLGQFFPADDYPAELSPICTCLNDTLQRLEKSFTRERQFNANVAHELRTPLAGMLSTIEVCLTRERQSAEYKDAFAECLQIVQTMNKMIDTLLSLSKLDSGQVSIQKQTIRLGEVVDNIWRRFSDKAYDKEIVFQNSIPDGAVCLSDKDCLDMVLSNVLENAVEYANMGGRIGSTLEQQDGTVTLLVSNTGCQLTQADVEKVFEFFWRKSSSRTDAGTHCGIGLPVARK